MQLHTRGARCGLPLMIVLHALDVLGRLSGVETKSQVDALAPASLVRQQRMQPVGLAVVPHDKERAMSERDVQMNDAAIYSPLALEGEDSLSSKRDGSYVRVWAQALIITWT
eukprot:CAMPEP_0180537772 /NCGR_PEP_ID=MMETSP1036_2-20121128/65993_1 /TAXON_ID=632150 /ORGANISM="Azadinium spinosum, Strain 3D9" /LENGTH=111 /DNA_ID=CAMNT_0022552387 /DNA_START=328 /DNA_END=663 /DNA_ORIENTATION=+